MIIARDNTYFPTEFKLEKLLSYSPSPGPRLLIAAAVAEKAE